MLLAVLISIVTAMGPMIRRAAEGMTKAVADHVGTQQNAEQLGGKYGHMIGDYTVSRADTNKNLRERLGETQYLHDDLTWRSSIVLANTGFTPEDQVVHGYTVD